MTNFRKRKGKISVVILSFHRPKNIPVLLEHLEKINIIDDIIIWHSNPDIKLEISDKFTKTTVVNTSRDFGLNVRWHASLLAKNDAIYMQDDDWLLSEKAIRQLYSFWRKKPNIIHSMWNRNSGPIYDPVDNKSGGKAEIILTNALIFDKKYAVGLLKILPTLDKKVVELTKKNGEDILFNYYVISQSGERNVAHDIGDEVKNLSHNNSISSRPSFRRQRDYIIGYCIRHLLSKKSANKRIRPNRLRSVYYSIDNNIGKIGILIKRKYPNIYYFIKKYTGKDGILSLIGIKKPNEPFRNKKNNVISIYRIDNYNVGDNYSNPATYFDFIRDSEGIDIIGKWDSNIIDRIKNSVVILGGGGLIEHNDFMPNIEELLKCEPKKIIIWGAGHNVHESDKIKMPKYFDKIDLIGIRDYGSKYPWVPCSSCMSPLFDKEYGIRHKIVVYEHQFERYRLSINSFPKMNNRETDIKKVIEFLGSGEIILTNSYHGAYWGTLLNRKVIIVNPFSSKFYGFKYKMPMANENNWQTKLEEAKNYPQALQECRKANLNFAEKVKKLLPE